MSNWGRLEHQVWNHLAEFGLQQNQEFALAVSGGMDSIVMLQFFLQLKPTVKLKVIHFHHGPSEDLKISEFRAASESLIEKTLAKAANSNVSLIVGRSDAELKSEDACREARWKFIDSKVNANEAILTAHHLDDRFETVLLKMIRGTSLEGASAFQMWNGKIFRPFLNISKAELLDFAKSADLRWVEDPTNKQNDFLRNWLRNEWLESLEAKVPGGRSNLAKSLFKMIEDANEDRTFEEAFLTHSSNKVLARHWFSLLSAHNQLRALALFIKKHNIHNFTAGQLEEIRKRLDKNQKELTFNLLGRKWVINATQIVIE